MGLVESILLAGGRGFGRGFSLFMGQPSHISPHHSHRSWIIHQTSLKIMPLRKMLDSDANEKEISLRKQYNSFAI